MPDTDNLAANDHPQHSTPQSKVLVTLCLALELGAGLALLRTAHPTGLLLQAAVVSMVFALLVVTLRAATWAGAVAGALTCFLLTAAPISPAPSVLSSGLTPLVLLFLLTFAATRAGRARKQRAGLAESRRGRTAAQVLANLAAAALFAACAALPAGVLQRHAAAACLAALAEATADTVSSELGQAFGGTPRMVLTLRPVPPGTDGAVSLLGTVSGVAGAAAIAMLGATALSLGHTAALGVLAAGTAGFLLDSLLGATLERAGVLGNDLVNFLSTVAAGLLALALKP